MGSRTTPTTHAAGAARNAGADTSVTREATAAPEVRAGAVPETRQQEQAEREVERDAAGAAAADDDDHHHREAVVQALLEEVGHLNPKLRDKR